MSLALIQILVPVLGTVGVLGRMQGAQFQIVKSPVVPAGYAFGIWGVLYAGCLVYAVEQARPSRRRDPVLRRIGWPFALALLVDAVWSALAQLEAPLSVLTLVIVPGLCGALLAAGRFYASGTGIPQDRWRVGAPVAGLAGWLTAAAFANVSVALPATWFLPGAQGEAVSIALLSACGLVAGLALWRLRAPVAYLAAVGWALVAVIVADVTRESAAGVAVAAGTWLTALVVLSAFAWNRSPATATGAA